MSTTTIIPTNNVEGNITSCKIETAEISVDRKSLTSFSEFTTYQSYDVCTKQVTSVYTLQELTGFGALCGLIIGFAIVMILMGMCIPSSDNPYRL